MQALGPRDINRAIVAAPPRPPEKPRAGGSGLNNGTKRKRHEPDIDYTSSQRKAPSFSYIEAAIAQIHIDFPMFYKTE
jgi:hypothetical protein